MANINCITLDGNIYNIMHGMNKNVVELLSILGLSSRDLGRFRDAWLNKDGSEIIIFTRNGGGNRDAYFPKDILNHPYYIRNYDDDFDNTYAYIVFKTPNAVLEITKKLSTGNEEKTLKEKTEESLKKMKKTGKVPIELQNVMKQIKEMVGN